MNDFDRPAVSLDHTERTHKKREARFWTPERKSGASIFGAGALIIGLAINVITTSDTTVCTDTVGAETVWANGEVALDDLQAKGSRIGDLNAVVDALVELPDNSGTKSGLTVCATQSNSFVGRLQPVSVSVGP